MDALFEITYEKEFTCPICMGAKVPYSTLSPCGHSLCAPCAEKCQQCPECRAAIVTRAVSAHMAPVVATHAHYQCNGCHQGGGHSFAQQHRCDQIMSALLKQLEDANAAHEVAMAAVVDGHKTQIEEYEAQLVAANDRTAKALKIAESYILKNSNTAHEVPVAGGPPANASAKNERASSE